MNFIEILNSGEIYPGYPAFHERTEMGKIRYDAWVSCGRHTGVATGLYDHPKYLKGVELGTALDDRIGDICFHDMEFAPSFTGEYARDASGRPVHPYAKEIFAAGLAVEGPGAYWTYGPNLCADPIVLGVSADGKLKTIVIERGDTNVVALPGGHCDPGENPMFTAFRELSEETGADIFVNDLQVVECVYQGIVPDPRTTINAWPETSAFAIILHPNAIDSYTVTGQDDAASAALRTVNAELFQSISKMHLEPLTLAVRFFEQTTNSDVQTDGSVAFR